MLKLHTYSNAKCIFRCLITYSHSNQLTVQRKVLLKNCNVIVIARYLIETETVYFKIIKILKESLSCGNQE
jgi:hypothetical protein